MYLAFPKQLCALTLAALVAVAAPATAETTTKAAQNTSHSHAHDHSADDIYKGIFDDAQIKARSLSDWAGDWQSVYPLLQNGALDSVMQHKAEHGEKSAEDYKKYYETGYATDVDRILFDGDSVTFFQNGEPVQGHYAEDGYEILTYKAGNRGVRYVFKKVSGDSAAPAFIQFSDHKIAPALADHYHLYWGDDRAALLKEVTNWPTYYPAKLTGAEIAAEMVAH